MRKQTGNMFEAYSNKFQMILRIKIQNVQPKVASSESTKSKICSLIHLWRE